MGPYSSIRSVVITVVTDFLEPGNQPKDLAAHHEHSVILLEHSRDRVNGHPLGLVFADGVINALNQP